MWYGKGPGLDRAMDALRHANQGGVAPHGGMVIAVGDDPTGKSSTLAYQSDQNFHSLGIPYFSPKMFLRYSYGVRGLHFHDTLDVVLV